ncbi:hypothetical protein YC2023_086979 [Brassica napus]
MSDKLTRRTTLPYLIRTRRKLPVYYSYALYNEDFIGYSSFDVHVHKLNFLINGESDDDDSSSKAVEPFSLEKGNESNASLSETDVYGSLMCLMNLAGVSTLSDEEYVVVDNVEVLPNSKTERMVLSKDTGSDSDA